MDENKRKIILGLIEKAQEELDEAAEELKKENDFQAHLIVEIGMARMQVILNHIMY